MRQSPQIINLETMARCLKELKNEVVVVGGAVVELLLTDEASTTVRPTDDVDVTIEIKSRLEYYSLEERLRTLGLKQHSDEPVICRWFGYGLKIDVMPDNPAILGFSNEWYSSAIQTAQSHRLPSGAEIRVIDAPHLLATKLAAFRSRGDGDVKFSHDFEDIVVLVNGRSELLSEMSYAPAPLRAFVKQCLSELVDRRDSLEAIEGALAANRDSLDRATKVIERLHGIIHTP